MSYTEKYAAYLSLINDKLEAYVAALEEKNIVSDAMRYSLMNGGKRVRPVLALAFCEMLGGDVERCLPFACALEMIHSSSLIHDDLPCMDDDDFRRGKPSCHKQFGEAYALLAGDDLILLALAVCSGSFDALDEKLCMACSRVLTAAAGNDGMIGGQCIDLLSEDKAISVERLQKLHRLKTGAMIAASCQMGAICAGADEQTVKDARLFGEYIGLQFQIVDDILDVTGSSEELGKPVGSDEENQKSTYVSLLGLERAREEAKALEIKALSILGKYAREDDFLINMTKKLLVRNK